MTVTAEHVVSPPKTMWGRIDGQIKPYVRDEQGKIHVLTWAAMPGSQEGFMQCSVQEVLYAGTRGPGKTDALLMSFAQHIGKWGKDWRGILFRRTYPELEDVIGKADKWFTEIFPEAAYNKGKHFWEWPEGERLYFAHMRVPSDYSKYHGHNYCVEKSTPVLMADGKYKSIEKIVSGDSVQTLNGSRRVLRTFSPELKSCVRVSCQALPSVSQVQSEDHRLLSSGEGLSGTWFDSYLSDDMLRTSPAQWRSYKDAPCAHPASDFSFVCKARKSLENDAPESCRKSLTIVPPDQFSRTFQGQPRQQFLKYTPDSDLSTPLRNHEEFFEQSLWKHLRHRRLLRTCLSLQPAHERSLQRSPAFFDASSCETFDQETLQGCSRNYLLDSNLCDAPLQQEGEIFPDAFRRQAYAEKHIRLHLLPDALDNAASRTLPRRSLYFHPYLPECRKSDKGTILEEAELQTCGTHWTVDIEVEGEGHYITKGGFVNQNCWIGFEELTTWPSADCFKSILSTNRTTNPNVPLMIRSTTNPHGSGHNWVKARYKLPVKAGERFGEICGGDELLNEKGRPILDNKGKPLLQPERIAIHGDIDENFLLLDADPGYKATIAASASSPSQLKAWLHGSWDVVAGGMFDDLWDSQVHIVEPFEIPKSWRIDRSFDWGSSKPSSVGWWAESDGTDYIDAAGFRVSTVRGDLFRIHEWYMCKKNEENKGLMLTDREIATGIKDLESQHPRLRNKMIHPGPADTSIWDTTNGSSIYKAMRDMGVRWTKADKSSGSRILGWQRIRNRLQASFKKEGLPREHPGLYVFDTCEAFIRTVPVIPRDDKNTDDVDTEAEDHIADELRYRVYSRTGRMKNKKIRGR